MRPFAKINPSRKCPTLQYSFHTLDLFRPKTDFSMVSLTSRTLSNHSLRLTRDISGACALLKYLDISIIIPLLLGQCWYILLKARVYKIWFVGEPPCHQVFSNVFTFPGYVPYNDFSVMSWTFPGYVPDTNFSVMSGHFLVCSGQRLGHVGIFSGLNQY